MKKILTATVVYLTIITVHAQTFFKDTNEKYGLKDDDDAVIFAGRYDEGFLFTEGLAPVKLNGKWGFIDATGAEVITPQFDAVSEYFSEGLVAVCQSDRWGYIDLSGNVVIPQRYEFAGPFSEGLAVVNPSGSDWEFIDHEGIPVIPMVKLHVDETYYMGVRFYNGRIHVVQSSEEGEDREFYIDKKGKEIN